VVVQNGCPSSLHLLHICLYQDKTCFNPWTKPHPYRCTHMHTRASTWSMNHQMNINAGLGSWSRERESVVNYIIQCYQLGPVCSVLSRLTLWPHGLYPAKLLCLWNFPGKNTGAVCHFLLQGIFPAPGIAPRSAASLELVGRFFTASATWEAHYKLQSPCFTLGLQTLFILWLEACTL